VSGGFAHQEQVPHAGRVRPIDRRCRVVLRGSAKDFQRILDVTFPDVVDGDDGHAVVAAGGGHCAHDHEVRLRDRMLRRSPIDRYPAGVLCSGGMQGYARNKEAIHKRLRRIEGQVRGLQRVVQEDSYCIDVVCPAAEEKLAEASAAIARLVWS
jgi:hypothetical protein